jgi:hypothetical protein
LAPRRANFAFKRREPVPINAGMRAALCLQESQFWQIFAVGHDGA